MPAAFSNAPSSLPRWLWALALVCSCTTQDARFFSISISSGGGFTGLVRGYRLQSEGQVVAFERRTAKDESILWTRSIDAGTMHSFAQKLLATGLLDQRAQEYGNVTSRIVYQSSDSTFVWTWSGSEPKPSAVAGWYREVMRYCSGLGPDSSPPRNRPFGGIHLTGVRRDPHQCSAADRHGRFAPGRSRLVGCPRRLGGSGGSFLGRRLAMRSWKRIGSWATASSSPR